VEDEYGDCTNAEEEEDRKEWNNKKYVKLDPAKIEIEETNSLPLDFADLFSEGCFTETKQRLKSFKKEKKSISVVVEKTYKTSGKCLNISDISELRYRSFSVDYSYSIFNLADASSKDFKVHKYNDTDESYFGFFKTERSEFNFENRDEFEIITKNW
jgi:hypothetical protein